MLNKIETPQGIYLHGRNGQQLTEDQQRWLGASLGRWLGQGCRPC